MKISKTFGFDYGHRVWSQKLNSEFSLDNKPVCRHLHGHRGSIEIILEGNVGESGMVTDFKHLNWFKKWVDDVIDHKFLIDATDPLFDTIAPNYKTFGLIDKGDYRIINTTSLKEEYLIELYESFIIVDFIPTSENITKWVHGVVQRKMNEIDIKVSAVKFKETPKSLCVYEN